MSDKIYGIFALTGPLNYFKSFADALAYWNYLEFGNGVDCPPCEVMGIHKDDLTMNEIKLFDVDNEEFMEMVHAANANRRSIEQAGRVLELRSVAATVHSWVDQAQMF